MDRLQKLVGHLETRQGGSLLKENKVASGFKRGTLENPITDEDEPENPVRWDGWGYKDTKFILNDAGQVELTGKRYLFSGKQMPELRKFMEEKVGLQVDDYSPSQEMPPPAAAVSNDAFVEAIKGQLYHAHGHTSQEIFALKFGNFPRVPDLIVWPSCHENVEAIVRAANEHNAVIIPFGGGTSVSHGLVCPEDERRMIVSLDMKAMNKIKWIDRKSMMACVEGGVVGKNLEARLKKYGLITGMEPDSAEFSTLGGWCATRASGMRKNKYGNIEDIVVAIKFVTSKGTLEKSVTVPRISTGPDVYQVILGSEGILGVVTEVTVKVRPAPKFTRYGSMIFPDFESGVACMHEVAMERCQPASIRLVDNMQFQFGQVLKPKTEALSKIVTDKIKKWYVTKHLKFNPEVMTAATLLFEGSHEEVAAQEKKIYAIATKHGGMKAGEENGIRGYFLTYMIAYLRDFGFNFRLLAESFETSVPWDKVLPLCQNVKNRIEEDCKEYGITTPPFISCRVTQTYDTGACVYFYFAFLGAGLENPGDVFSVIEHNARDEILKNGGSLSHHHGVGKMRKHWMEETVSPTGVALLEGMKRALDPKNVFANGNLIDFKP